MATRRHAQPICTHLNGVERDVVNEMKAMTGILSDCNLARLALWHLARHLDVRIDKDVFRARSEARTARRTA